jgi:hypothetical protein
MTHYFIRRKSENIVEIGKFDPFRSGPPLDIYTIHGGRCDCPSPQHPCKHNFLVTKWELLGDRKYGMYYDDQTERFYTHPWALWMLPQSMAEMIGLTAADISHLRELDVTQK